jgi:hypothetical protein
MTTPNDDIWTFDEALAVVSGIDGAVAVVASAETGAPEAAWGDVFVFDADSDDRRFPFATIVTKDAPGFDTVSGLDREGVYRLNIGVGRDVFQELLGYDPADHARFREEHDFAEPDRMLPHPTYAAQAWVSAVTPGPRTGELVQRLLVAALDRHRRRGGH